jgi:uncharacterized protein YbaR (Trm112 family)
MPLAHCTRVRESANIELHPMPKKCPPSARTIKSEELRWLACPVCFSSLALETTAVRCIGCTRSYPIVDGIPVLLASRATADAPLRF